MTTDTRAMQALPELPEPQIRSVGAMPSLFTADQMHAHARAALSAASAPGVPAGIVPATETAWLVEWKAHGFGPQWWGFNYEPGKRGMWCSDANNAVRFARKEDALRMRLHVIAVAGLTGRHTYEGEISVTEHEWCDGRSDALSASPPPPTEQKAVAPAMTPWRAAYFMERFLHEEKMLGPNEQAALRFVIAMLETTPPPTEQSEQARPGGISARACEWDQDSSAQWTDRYYGFSIIEEQGDELPFSAAWGEDDGEQFATLEEAKAWCQSQVDGWIAKYAVLPGQQSEQARQPLTDEQIEALRGLDTDKRVRFYEHDFYVLSNFSAFNLEWMGLTFPTSEHAYHWEKFGVEGEWCSDEIGDVLHAIHSAPSAHDAFKIAERNKPLRRADWDGVKVDTMRRILHAKAAQHEYVRRKLLDTGDRELVEDSWRDDFWGWGPNRDGQNMLGKLWMEVRDELRAHHIGTAPTTADQPARPEGEHG